MKKISLISMLALMTSALGFSQSLPSKCIAFCPQELNKSTIYKSKTDELAKNNYGQNGASTNKYWDVYSDRCNNVVYKGPSISSGTTGKTLKFNQKLRIAEVKDGFARVYVENRPGGVNYPQLSSDCKAVGWVPMDHLLLWQSCPTNDVGIYRKALIVRNIDQKRDQSFGRISQSPDVNDTTGDKAVKSSIDFHYIMKVAGTKSTPRYLLAKYNKLSGTTDQVLEGWVSENTFTAWNQRSCLEPNWDEDDVEYFISRNEQAWLYEDSKLTSKTQPWSYGQKNSENQPTTQYRMRPRSMRFPLHDKENNREDIFKITAFGAANGELGQQSVAIDDSREKREKYLNEASHINVIVVIDGTRSMGKYFSAMAKAVQDATSYFQNDVSVGAVIYRDYSDGEANVIEYQKVTKPSDAGLQSFLKNVGRNGYGATSSSRDNTNHEALYLGLKTALDYKKMGYSPKNNNLIFVVGDCGNNPNDKSVSKTELLAMCKETSAQLFSFQVLNQDKQAWDDFNTQLTDLFIEHMAYMYSSLNAGVKVNWRPVKNGMSIRSNAKEHFYVSEIHRGQPGVELSEGELTALIQDSYKVFRNAVEEQKNVIENAGSGLIATDGDKDMRTISIREDFLKRRLGSDYKAIKDANAMLAYEGYAKKDDGQNHDYWKAVVFLSSEELVELIKKLEPLKAAVKVNSYGSQERANYVKAVAGIIQSMTERSAEEIEQLSTDEITRVIGGLNASTPMLKGKQNDKTYTLSDIKNASACPDADFKKILKRMESKIDDLSALPRGTNFKYCLTQNGEK